MTDAQMVAEQQPGRLCLTRGACGFRLCVLVHVILVTIVLSTFHASLLNMESHHT